MLLVQKEVQDAIARQWDVTPMLPAGWSVDFHEQALARRSRQLFAHFCPREPTAPKKQWITAQTWTAMRASRQVRKQAFWLRRRKQAHSVAAVFLLWRHAAGVISQVGFEILWLGNCERRKKLDESEAYAWELAAKQVRVTRAAVKQDRRQWFEGPPLG